MSCRFELAVCLLALSLAARWLGPPSRGVLRALGGVWVVLTLSHYADVTAPALYGRQVNLYWDSRNLSAVAEMLGRAAPVWLVVAVLLGAALVLGLLYLATRWALGRVGAAMADGRTRLVLGALGGAAIALFAVRGYQSTDRQAAGLLRFPSPVTRTYVRQVRLVVQARLAAHSHILPPSPPMDSDLSRVAGADVVVLFIESYGQVSFERPEFTERLAPARAALEAAIRDTGRSVISASVDSPTFGGNSWLAHISLLSGVEVKDPDTNALLMTQKRDTLVKAFGRHGYRTVALMPGLWQRWPEGVFYGFDEIDGGSQLGYGGPPFGWWDIPDQYTFAKLDEIEARHAGDAPLFVVFPTVSTHIPFSPVPPVPARLVADAHDDALRAGRRRTGVGTAARLAESRAELREGADLHVPLARRLPAPPSRPRSRPDRARRSPASGGCER